MALGRPTCWRCSPDPPAAAVVRPELSSDARCADCGGDDAPLCRYRPHQARIPDQTTIQAIRHLLEKQELGAQCFEA